ncbi:DUF1829 domain-containing protein [Neolewinella lacunae]|uniref:DUF1829 domain-containing protein n=1 Tax=Neolewinella lacunae TaxID=1517758 RepID=A0A923PKE5_9BACT|nr:DUF1829 domain-containing protein [Neolewinella lacunae]MBC6994311.1 DUF1829 domain-containing protein [Neolewinella lacunae]MDN3634931.1 DUF1829 domain-containing protein [Neolewinella lacunae]
MNATIKEYTDWLRDETEIYPADDGWMQLVLPDVNFNNDNLEVYLKQQPDGTVLYSDGKQTLRELDMAGVSVSRGKRKEEVTSILAAYGIRMQDEELLVQAPIGKKEAALHRLLGAMRELLDLRVLAQEKVKSFFLDDFQDLLLARDIPFLRNPTFYGKSGLAQTLDFALPQTKKRPETLIKAIGQPRQDRVLNAIMVINDTLALRPNSQGLVVLNDLEGLNADLEQALVSYQVPYQKMSERETLVRHLKPAA